MKKNCLLPSTIDELQAELERQHLSIQKFFLDENISPEERNKILMSALRSQENVDFFVDTVYDEIITPTLERKAVKVLEKEHLEQDVVKDVVLNRIRRLQGRLSPEYEGMYLENLVKEDMKLALNQEQAESLVDAQTSIDSALEDLNSAIADAKDENGKPLFDVKSYKDIYKETDKQKIKENEKLYQKYLTLGLAVVKYKNTYANISEELLSKGMQAVATKIVGSTRSAILSADMGFGRNISNMFFVSPKTGFKAWWKGAVRTAQDLWYGKEKDKNGFTKQDYAWAEIYADPNVISGRMKQLGVNIGITEEQFLNSYITQLTEKSEDISRDETANRAKKIAAYVGRPILRLYSSSESGFNMAVNYARFTYANMMIDLYNAKTKQDIKLLKDNGVGDLIMEQTGRWNKFKDPEMVDKISFYMMAMRWTASRIATAKNIIYAPVAIADVFAGKKGIKNLDTFYFNKTNVDKGRSAIGLVFGMATLSALINAAISDDDEKEYWEKLLEGLDPTSSDYGKIVVGKTRFDITFGVGAVITTVGKTINAFFNRGGYGEDTWDPLARFLKNRQAPIVSITTGALEHFWATFVDERHLPTDIMGEPETFNEYVRGILLPIYVDSIIEYTGEDRDEEVSTLEASAAVISDVLGISATTYSKKASKAEILEKWGKASPLMKISGRTKLAKTLSKEDLKKAEDELERRFTYEAGILMSSSMYNSMSKEEKDKELDKIHRKILRDLEKGLK